MGKFGSFQMQPRQVHVYRAPQWQCLRSSVFIKLFNLRHCQDALSLLPKAVLGPEGWHLSDCQDRSIPLVLTRVQCMQKGQRTQSPPRLHDKRPFVLISSSDFEPWSVCRDKLRFPAVHTCELYQAQLTLPYW